MEIFGKQMEEYRQRREKERAEKDGRQPTDARPPAAAK
jgi:hypothetical protein